MKIHTSQFKENIKEMGKSIDSIITYDDTTLHDELYAVTPLFEGNLLKSIMKQLDVESTVDIPLNTVINYRLGLLVNGSYEYLNFGNYVVYKSEKQEDTDTYQITCYDKMLYSMKQNEDLGITYPITIKNYLTAIANRIGLQLKDTTFANQDLEIQNELYVGLEYTYRDILDEISQATGSNIIINDEDQLEVKYFTDTEDTIDEEYLKDVNVKFGEKYGPINSIVLSRAAESDNVYLSDDESVQKNGLCELKIIDNQIMNFNNRSDYLQGILDKLDGLYFYINDFNSTGICYYDVCDIYNIRIGETTYKCVMLNDEINVTTGLEEIIHTNMPEEGQTDYTKADKTDRRINQTYIIADKQQGQIEALISEQDDQQQQLTSIVANVNNIQNLFQITGGHNLIKNSMGLLGDDGWTKMSQRTNVRFPGSGSYPSSSIQPLFYAFQEPVYEFGYDANLIGSMVSVAKRKIQNGQIITRSDNITNLIVGMQYTLSFIIDNDENTTTTIQLVGNKINFNRTWNTETRKEKVEFSFIAETTNYTFKMSSSTTTDGYGTIYDLMLNSGDVTPWEPAFAEIYSTTIQLSQMGLQVYCTGSDIATLMTSQGFQVRRFENNTLYEVVTEFTKDGMISKKSILEEMQVKDFEFKTIDYSGYETLIIYKKDTEV